MHTSSLHFVNKSSTHYGCLSILSLFFSTPVLSILHLIRWKLLSLAPTLQKSSVLKFHGLVAILSSAISRWILFIYWCWDKVTITTSWKIRLFSACRATSFTSVVLPTPTIPYTPRVYTSLFTQGLHYTIHGWFVGGKRDKVTDWKFSDAHRWTYVRNRVEFWPSFWSSQTSRWVCTTFYLVSSNTRTRIKKTSDILFGNTNIILHLKFHLLNSSILHWGINGLTFTWSSLPVYYYGIFFSPNFMISFLSLELWLR